MKQKQFLEFFLKISDDTYIINPNTEDIISLPLNIVLFEGTLTNLYSNLVENFGKANYIVSKAILTSKILMLKLFQI